MKHYLRLQHGVTSVLRRRIHVEDDLHLRRPLGDVHLDQVHGVDAKIRAFDKTSGALLWEAALPAAGYATPSTYEVNGRQYVVVAAGGGKLGSKSGDAYVAFANDGGERCCRANGVDAARADLPRHGDVNVPVACC